MADASQSAPSGTSSTPTVTPAPIAAVTEGDSAPASTTTDATSTATQTTAPAPSVSTERAPGPEAPQDVAPPAEAAPLFTLPEDVQFAPDARSKFETFLKGKLGTDGKLSLTSQEVADHFADQARDTIARWQQSITQRDQANEAICKQRFTPVQLAASETAIGFLSSFDPTFRDLAKRQLNDPVFVNAMRIIGERLSEDTLEVSAAASEPQKKSREERMGYAKPRTN